MDRITFMRAFCRIAELRSFSKAAADMGVSPAVLSRETKLLEDSLGCQLIARTTRSMSLTENGERYYAESQRILGELDALDQNIRDGAGALKGALKINAPLSFGLTVLSAALPKFMESHPDVKLSMTLDDRVLDMVEGGFDISIRVRADLPDSSLIAHRIGAVEQQLFAAPAYLDARGRPRVPADLKGHDLLAFTLADHAAKWELHGPDGETNVSLDPVAHVNNSLLLRDLLAAGQGIGALPGFIFRKALADGVLERVLPDYSLPDRIIYAVASTRLDGDSKIKAFLDHLRREFLGLGRDGILSPR